MRRPFVIVAMVGLFAAGCTGGRSANSPSSSSPAKSISLVTMPSWPDCGAIDVGSAQYGSHLSADRGRPGATVVLFGPTLRAENGRYAPATKVEAWWNWNNVSGGPPLDPGPVFLLAAQAIQGLCAFQTSFKVPRVASGTYRIVVFIFSSEGFGLFGCHYFTVGTAPPPPTPPKSSLADCAEIR